MVIGIILILIGLFFAGGKIISGQAKERDTKTTLETCKTLFENYRNATHLSRPPTLIPIAGGVTITTSNLSGIPTPVQRFWTVGQVDAPAPGQVPNTSPYNLTSASGIDPAVLETICVMYTLESIPENKTIINNLPANKILNVVFTNSTTGVQMSVPLLLDGWGNPILFVPGGGFGVSGATAAPGVVWIDGVNYGVVTSAGVYTLATTPSVSSYDAAAPGTIYANQPFFVSAGSDGDFSNASGNKTDDNVYSFK